MNDVGLIVAFIAGLVSFLSPCVLPIIPGFLAYLAGGGTAQGGPSRRQIFFNSFFFVLGFSVVFALLGVLLNTVLESVAYDVQIWLSRIGGLIIIVFGLYLARIIKIPWLDRDYKIQVKVRFSSKYLTSFLFGLAFAVGWTPCVGAALGAILALAAVNPATAFWLLFAYSLGLGLPFLVVGLLAAQASPLISRMGKFLNYLNFSFGIILIVLGILVFTQTLNLVANLELLNKFLIR